MAFSKIIFAECSKFGKMSTLKKNLAYQTVYQLISTCLPLITSPYLARALGATQQGVFSYTQSIVNYFTLFAMLGVVNYGTRTIASISSDKNQRSICFWSIYLFQFFLSLISTVVYFLYLFLICKDNWCIACIQGLYILGALLDINWLFFGVEKFEITVKRSLIIRLISLIAILLFVNRPEDLWVYTMIMAGGTVFSNAVLWRFVPSIIEISSIKQVSISSIKQHIKPNIVLFIPLMAMSVYHVMDKTMLGLLSSYTQTGYYYNADKVINIPISIINGVGTVMLPRMSALAEAGNDEESEKIFKLSIEMIVLVSTAIAFGIASISKEFTPFFFGTGFDPCINLIIVLAPVLILKSLSQTSRMQYLIPKRKENIFIQSVIAGAIINFIVNLCLISRFGALGAVIGTLSAEFVTFLWQYFKMNRHISIWVTVIGSLIYLIFGLIMFGVVRLFALFLPDGIIGISLEIVVGAVVYICLCIGMWNATKHPFLNIIKELKR